MPVKPWRTESLDSPGCRKSLAVTSRMRSVRLSAIDHARRRAIAAGPCRSVSARRTVRIGAPRCSTCSKTTCSTPSGGSSAGAPRRLPSGRRSSTCCSFWCSNREHVVSKDDLLNAVWNGRIVSESTLTSHINAARKAIGDSGERAAPDPDDRPQGIPVRRRGQGSAAAGRSPRTPRARDRTSRCAHAAGSARQALDRRPAIPESERRPGTGIFRRRRRRGHHHGAVAHPLAVRHRAQFELHLQGPRGRREAGRPRAGRALRAGRQHAQGREPRAHHRAAHRRDDRGASLGRALRRHARRHLRAAGSGRRRASSARSRRSSSAPRSSAPNASRPKASTPTTTICAAWRTSTEGPGRPSTTALPSFHNAIELDPDFASAYRDGRVVLFLAQGQWLDDRPRRRDRRGRAPGPPGRGTGQGRCGRARAEAGTRSAISSATSTAASR